MLEQILWTATVTPFTADGSAVDYPSLENCLRRQEKSGNGIVLMGSTGEGLSFTNKERREIVEFACGLNLQTQLVIGVPSHNYYSALEWLEFCNSLPIQGYLLTTPIYTKPGVMGQTHWYEAMLDKAAHPAILYNIPGRAAVRSGAHIGKNVVIMPPSYVNIGTFVDESSMIDSHVLIGSCAQIGKRIHLAAGVQIGGVLEPVGNRPVIVEDDCFIGAGAILMEGILVRQGAVIAPGVTLSAAVPIYDVINETIIKGEIPEYAVVVPGTRKITSSEWATTEGLSLNCAIIVKYRDAKTSAALVLEDVLR